MSEIISEGVINFFVKTEAEPFENAEGEPRYRYTTTLSFLDVPLTVETIETQEEVEDYMPVGWDHQTAVLRAFATRLKEVMYP